MLRTLKAVFPLREIARIIDLHFQKTEQLLSRIEEVHRIQHHGIEQARFADCEAAQNHAAFLKALTYIVEQLQQLRALFERLEFSRNPELRNLVEQVAELRSGLRTPISLATEDFDLLNPDVGLLVFLFAFLPSRNALDIGANVGEVSQRLLDAGYEVFAFEPFPSTFAQLTSRLAGREGFHGHQLAIGSADRRMDLHIVSANSKVGKSEGSTSLYHSLLRHSLTDDLEFTQKTEVQVRSLESLRLANEIPTDIGLIKVDIEGYELEVIRGMGNCPCTVLMAEFWDRDMAFGKSGAMNRLDDLVAALRPLGYRWYIVIYRLDGKPISYYCNQPRSFGASWGNAIFFKDRPIFQEALQWCSAVLPATYFRSGQ